MKVGRKKKDVSEREKGVMKEQRKTKEKRKEGRKEEEEKSM